MYRTTAVAGSILLVSSAVMHQSAMQSLYKRFPEVEKRTLRRANRALLRDLFLGRLRGVDLKNDSVFDRVFWSKVQQITA